MAGLEIGGGAPVSVQSMCNTDTADVAASIRQCIELHEAGAQLIRLTTQGMREVAALGQIRTELRSMGILTPLVADVHFSADVALAAAAGIADKVRINPGNFSKDHDVAMAKFRELIAICRRYGTAIRIGLNHGSLGERITSRYGDTPKGMVEAVMEWLKVCVAEDFYNVTVSLKASNTNVMTAAYRLLFNTMAEEFGFLFPLHLGVTEAGNGDSGRIKSAVGIGTLLQEGIGETIRVSLTESPAAEIPAALKLVEFAHKGLLQKEFNKNHSLDLKAADWNEFILAAAFAAAPKVLSGEIDDFQLDGTVAGERVLPAQIADFKEELMQACRRRFSKPEYIACPSCGRTHYDIEKVLADIKSATAEFVGVKIAVMGCIVNGPGEMADADYGYVGAGPGHITLYRGKEAV